LKAIDTNAPLLFSETSVRSTNRMASMIFFSWLFIWNGLFFVF